MIIEIIISGDSCYEKNFDFNKIFVRAQMMYLKDSYEAKGYLYLNTVYECLSLPWNPYDTNICLVYERDGELKVDLLVGENTKEIKISISAN